MAHACRPTAPLLGVGMNSVAMPLFAWLVVAMIGKSLLGRELSLGLLVAAATPCTLASAAVWTRRAGGNDAVSIMVTVITNASCFLVTPFWLLLTTGQQAELDASRDDHQAGTGGRLAHDPGPTRTAGSPRSDIGQRSNKTPLGVLAQLGVLTMIFFGSIQTGQRFAVAETRPGLSQLITLLICVIGIHVLILWAGMLAASALKIARPDQIAVGLAGSQKTLMVGLQVSHRTGLQHHPDGGVSHQSAVGRHADRRSAAPAERPGRKLPGFDPSRPLLAGGANAILRVLCGHWQNELSPFAAGT